LLPLFPSNSRGNNRIRPTLTNSGSKLPHSKAAAEPPQKQIASDAKFQPKLCEFPVISRRFFQPKERSCSRCI
jgi:hypothetical protein